MKPKSTSPTSAAERVSAGREPLRAPDLRNPKVRAAIRREAAMLDQHPENAAINAWLEAMLEDLETNSTAPF